VPENVFVASLKAAVYANGFYVAPHHSALQLGKCPICYITRTLHNASIVLRHTSERRGGQKQCYSQQAISLNDHADT